MEVPLEGQDKSSPCSPFLSWQTASGKPVEQRASCRIAASITSCNFCLKSTSNFRYYNSPPKSKRTQKRDQAYRLKVDPSPYILFIDIDDILHSSSAGLGPVPDFAEDTLEGGDRGTRGIRCTCLSGD